MSSKQYNFIAVAMCSYDMGIAIIDIEYDIDDKVKCVAFNGNTTSKPTWHKLYTNSQGRAYFIKYKRRYYLDEMPRCDY